MFKIVRCKGVLLKAMKRNTQQISIVSFFLFTIPIIIVALCYDPVSTMGRICAGLLLWYMVSLVILKRLDYDETINKIFTLPIFISLKLSVLIFKFFLKRKYPEMEEDHYNRWVKLQKLKRKINE